MQVVIRAVPERIYIVKEIKNNIPEAIPIFDKYRDAMETSLRALAEVGDSATIQMEDDVVLTSNFLDKANAIIKTVKENYGDILIQFFSMREADIEIGSRLEAGRGFSSTCCTYYPKGMAKDILKWVETIDLPSYQTATDWIVRDYLQSKKLKYWISIPSLVEHMELKSAINPRRSSKRHSKTFEA